jgi:elongation factor P
MVIVDMYEGAPVGVELPVTVDLKVIETTPEVKGATASAQRKPAKLETGLVVQVPSFIGEGERIRVSTEDGNYMERVK